MLKFLRPVLKLNSLFGVIVITIFFSFVLSCTRIYYYNESKENQNELKITNNLKDFNPEKQTLYISFVNPTSKQILILDLRQKSPKDTLVFLGNISDFNKTFSHNFSLEIPIKSLDEIRGRKISTSSFTIESANTSNRSTNDSLNSYQSGFFSKNIPALFYDIENYYSDEELIQTMRGKISSPNGNQVDFYAISDFVPFLIWGAVLIAGGSISYRLFGQENNNNNPCADPVIIRSIDFCHKNNFDYETTIENGKCIWKGCKQLPSSKK
ncbi:MAG: hypothetical protein JNM22_13520 [Saprospiraceae bacterium]|nr:hypothetical protein [Saprospiraceae bacterium]